MRSDAHSNIVEPTRDVAQIDVGLLLLVPVPIEPLPNHFRHLVLRALEDLVLMRASHCHLGLEGHSQNDQRLDQRSAQLRQIAARKHIEVRCCGENVHRQLEQLLFSEPTLAYQKEDVRLHGLRQADDKIEQQEAAADEKQQPREK